MSSKIDKALEKFDITENSLIQLLTKDVKKEKELTSFNNSNVNENQLHQTDILYLPKTSKGYKFCLVIVDVATKKVTIEPLKKINGDIIEKALEVVYNDRKHLDKPMILQMDSGPEFKNKKVKKWLDENKIGSRYSEKSRHSQQAVVEAMNRTIGTTILKVLNNDRLNGKKKDKDWNEFINVIEDVLNDNTSKVIYKSRTGREKILVKKKNLKNGEDVLPENTKVRIKLDGDKFRGGDVRWSIDVYKITRILLLPNRPVQYIVVPDGKGKEKNNAFLRSQLKVFKSASQLKKEVVVKRLIARRKKEGSRMIEYLLQYSDGKKAVVLRKDLMKSIPSMVKAFEKNKK